MLSWYPGTDRGTGSQKMCMRSFLHDGRWKRQSSRAASERHAGQSRSGRGGGGRWMGASRIFLLSPRASLLSPSPSLPLFLSPSELLEQLLEHHIERLLLGRHRGDGGGGSGVARRTGSDASMQWGGPVPAAVMARGAVAVTVDHCLCGVPAQRRGFASLLCSARLCSCRRASRPLGLDLWPPAQKASAVPLCGAAVP